MKKLFLLLLCALSANAGTFHCTWNFNDFTLSPLAIKQVTIQPIAPYGVNSNATIITGDQIVKQTAGTGTLTVSNMVNGRSYRVRLEGLPTLWGTNFVTQFTNSFDTNVTGLVNGAASEYLAAQVRDTSTIAYSQAVSDARFLNRTNGSGHAVTLGGTNTVYALSLGGEARTNWPTSGGSGTYDYAQLTNKPTGLAGNTNHALALASLNTNHSAYLAGLLSNHVALATAPLQHRYYVGDSLVAYSNANFPIWKLTNALEVLSNCVIEVLPGVSYLSANQTTYTSNGVSLVGSGPGISIISNNPATTVSVFNFAYDSGAESMSILAQIELRGSNTWLRNCDVVAEYGTCYLVSTWDKVLIDSCRFISGTDGIADESAITNISHRALIKNTTIDCQYTANPSFSAVQGLVHQEGDIWMVGGSIKCRNGVETFGVRTKQQYGHGSLRLTGVGIDVAGTNTVKPILHDNIYFSLVGFTNVPPGTPLIIENMGLPLGGVYGEAIASGGLMVTNSYYPGTITASGFVGSLNASNIVGLVATNNMPYNAVVPGSGVIVTNQAALYVWDGSIWNPSINALNLTNLQTPQLSGLLAPKQLAPTNTVPDGAILNYRGGTNMWSGNLNWNGTTLSISNSGNVLILGGGTGTVGLNVGNRTLFVTNGAIGLGIVPSYFFDVNGATRIASYLGVNSTIDANSGAVSGSGFYLAGGAWIDKQLKVGSNAVVSGTFSATKGIGGPTNAEPTSVTIGVTSPDAWFVYTGTNGVSYKVPAWINH